MRENTTRWILRGLAQIILSAVGMAVEVMRFPLGVADVMLEAANDKICDALEAIDATNQG